MQIVALPSVIDYREAVDFSLLLKEVPESNEYRFDLCNITTVRPFGMLLVSSVLRNFVKNKRLENPDLYKFQVANFNKNIPSHGYAAHVGFFRSWGAPYGSGPGDIEGNSRYKPIKELSVENIKAQSFSRMIHYGELIEEASKEFAIFLGVSSEEDIINTLTYAIREIIRNVFEHSQAGSVWLVGQYWPVYQMVEVAILDEGVGLLRSLKCNPKIIVDNHENALNLALRPGVSGKLVGFKQRRGEDDVWANSGYGLFVTSRLCQKGGKYFIVSGDKGLLLEGEDASFFDCSFQGTAIMMQLQLSSIGALASTLRNIVAEGRRVAKTADLRGNLTASMITTSLSEWIKSKL